MLSGPGGGQKQISGMNFLFVGDLMELTLGGVPIQGYSMSGELWRDTKMVSLHKTASADRKCQEPIGPFRSSC